MTGPELDAGTQPEMPTPAAVVLPRQDDPSTSPFEPLSGDGRTWRRHRPIIAAVGLILGALVIWTGATVAFPLPTSRAAIIVLGTVILLTGIDSLLKLLIGEQARTATILSTVWLILLILAAVFADLLPIAEATDTAATLTEPALQRPDLFSGHPLGTDGQGLDTLGGIIYGARVSLIVGIGAVTVGLLVGGLLGMVAGYYRSWVEAVINLASDALIAFPPLILLLALVAVLEPSVRNVTLGLALLSVPIYIRLARANTLRFVRRDFVRMARALGGRDRRILFREVMPNVAAPLISYGFVIVAVLIVAEASLSYLGLSVQRPAPTWGNLIAAGEDSFDRNPHLVFAPGIVLFLTVFALNRVGEAARSRWEVR